MKDIKSSVKADFWITGVQKSLSLLYGCILELFSIFINLKILILQWQHLLP